MHFLAALDTHLVSPDALTAAERRGVLAKTVSCHRT